MHKTIDNKIKNTYIVLFLVSLAVCLFLPISWGDDSIFQEKSANLNLLSFIDGSARPFTDSLTFIFSKYKILWRLLNPVVMVSLLYGISSLLPFRINSKYYTIKEEKNMGMVVQHNLTAQNANRQLGITTGLMAKSTEKLSSGYRINRASDDAAGLSISEKMRNQIRGLDRASANAQDGISLIQTAEGALNESHAILQRMSELCVQAANDTNMTVDRTAISEEISQLSQELTRISSTTQFNKKNLLDGTLSGAKLQIGANEGQNMAVSIDSTSATVLGVTASDIQVDTHENASSSITKVQGAIDTLSSVPSNTPQNYRQ